MSGNVYGDVRMIYSENDKGKATWEIDCSGGTTLLTITFTERKKMKAESVAAAFLSVVNNVGEKDAKAAARTMSAAAMELWKLKTPATE